MADELLQSVLSWLDRKRRAAASREEASVLSVRIRRVLANDGTARADEHTAMIDEEDAPSGPRPDPFVESDLLELDAAVAEAIANDLRQTLPRSAAAELIAAALRPRNAQRQALLIIPRATSFEQREDYERVIRWANQQADKEPRAAFARALINAFGVAKM
jgi:hypothetical protein